MPTIPHFKMGSGVYFPWGKSGLGVNLTTALSSAEVKNAWSYASTPPHVFMAWCLIKHRIRLHGVVLS